MAKHQRAITHTEKPNNSLLATSFKKMNTDSGTKKGVKLEDKPHNSKSDSSSSQISSSSSSSDGLSPFESKIFLYDLD